MSFKAPGKGYKTYGKFSLPTLTMACFGRQPSVTHNYIYGFLGLALLEESQRLTVDNRTSHRGLYRGFKEEVPVSLVKDDFQRIDLLSFYKPGSRSPLWIANPSSQGLMRKHGGNYLAMDSCWRCPPEPRYSMKTT